MTQSKDSPGNKRGAGRTEGRKRLGDNLRQMYDEVVQEPIPQEMLDLLARLKDDGDTKR